MIKTCKKCNQEKDLTLFAKGAKYKDGYRNICRRCHTDYVNNYYKENPDKYAAKKELNSYVRPNWYVHKISEETYLELLNKHDGKCHACKDRKATSIDHDHACCKGYRSCGKCVRGVLCSQCNTALGLLQDSSEVVSKLLEYRSQV